MISKKELKSLEFTEVYTLLAIRLTGLQNLKFSRLVDEFGEGSISKQNSLRQGVQSLYEKGYVDIKYWPVIDLNEKPKIIFDD